MKRPTLLLALSGDTQEGSSFAASISRNSPSVSLILLRTSVLVNPVINGQ